MTEIDLDQLKGSEKFQIPEGYFDRLPSQVMNTIRKERARRRTFAITSIAAVALVVICSTLIINFKNNENAVEKELAIEVAKQNEQIEEQMVDYYSDELAQMDYYNY